MDPNIANEFERTDSSITSHRDASSGEIAFATGMSTLGTVLVARSVRGVCAILIGSEDRELFGGRRALFYNITARRLTHPEEFKADMATLFELLRDGAIHPVVIDRLPLAAASEVHARIDAGGLGGKIVLLPWPASATKHTTAIMK
jgi:NADPH:quinone reductase